MTNAIHQSLSSASIPIDPERFLREADSAHAGWWAALIVLILLVVGAWLMRYFVGQNQEMVVELKRSNERTVDILAGAIKENTQINAAYTSELRALRDSVGRVESAVSMRLSVRGQQQMKEGGGNG